jgi:hypothetical protein
MNNLDPTLSASEDLGTDVVRIAWRRSIGAGRVAHHFVYPSTELTPQYSSALIARLLCYYLIDLVPDEGLHDAVTSLSETIDFHATNDAALSPVNEHQYLPAEMGKTFRNPAFELDPD